MNVPSFAFLGFAAVVAVVINISDRPAWRRAILIVANLAFVLTFAHDPLVLAPFAGFVAFGFLARKLVEARRQRALFAVVVVVTVLALCWLKKYAFVPAVTYLPNIYLTVGISYVFFRILHLIIDGYQEPEPRRVTLLSYLSYTLEFTALVSGPVQLYGDYLRTESEKPLPLTWDLAGEALTRIVTGFFKVAIISQVLAMWQAQAITAFVPGLGFVERVVLLAAIVAIFPSYLYFNFSGYTDFVIGVARFMRLDLPENFNKPFTAQSFMDFWSRWHMTLSNWLKTYVYTPVLLTLLRRYDAPRVAPFMGVIAFFVTFFLVGLWHGSTTMFAFFGVLQGLGVSLNKLFQILMQQRLGRKPYKALSARPIYASLSRGLTFSYFAFSLLWFWSTWAQLGNFVTTAGPFGTISALMLMWLVAAPVLSALIWLRARFDEIRFGAETLVGSAYARTVWLTLLVVTIGSITVIFNAPAATIVYKAF